LHCRTIKKTFLATRKRKKAPLGHSKCIVLDEANSGQRVKISRHSSSLYRYSDVLCEHARALEKTPWQEKRERGGERKKFMLPTHAVDKGKSTATIRIVR